MVQKVISYVVSIVSLLTKKTCNSCQCEWASLLYAVKCCFVCLYPVLPNLDVLRVTGSECSSCSCQSSLLCASLAAPCIQRWLAGLCCARVAGPGLCPRGWAGNHCNLLVQPRWESTSCSHAKGCLSPRWPVWVTIGRVGCLICVRSSSSGSRIV